MKTILFISPTGTLENGAEVSIFFLMKQLVEDGYNVINVFPKSYKHGQRTYIKKMTAAGIKVRRIDVLKWWWPNAPVTEGISKKDRDFYYDANFRELLQIMYKEQVDLVISNTVNVFLGAYAADKLGIPHFWLIHEYPENEFSYYIEYISEISRLSQKIFSVGGPLNEELNRLFLGRQIDTFYPYVDVINESSTVKESLVDTPITLFSIGKITKRKNQLELIKAFGEVKIQFPDIELMLIGDAEPKYLQECKNYLKEKRIQNVHFLGVKDHPWTEVPDNAICVLTSKNETFGLVYVEALLNGVPVIISNNDGFLTAYGLFGKGIIYKQGMHNELVKIICQMIVDFRSYKSEFLKYRKEASKIYTSSKMYQNIIREINNLNYSTSLTSDNYDTIHLTYYKKRENIRKFWIKIKIVVSYLIRKFNS